MAGNFEKKYCGPYYHHLNSEDQAELRGHIQIFLHEKKFEGLNGFDTDEIKVTIAAQACICCFIAIQIITRHCLQFGLSSSFFQTSNKNLAGGIVAEGEHRED